MKERYIDIMEKALSAYTEEHMISYFEKVKEEGLTEHGFARLTANIGILLAHGRREELRPLFVEMMDFCCKNMPISDAANDFTVREILLCLEALEEKRAFDIEKIIWWKSYFIEIDRDRCYRKFIKNEDEDPRNWAFFTLVSEWTRKYCGLCDTLDFVELQLVSQMRRFDEQGQYHDHCTNRTPHQPIVYDIVPRMLTAILLHLGYRGRYYEDLRALIKKVTPLTLASQSVTGEIAYGGRSNQFIHNEAMLVAFLEFAANLFYEDGDLETAKKCKAAIRLAVENMELWLGKEPIRHVKNRFPTETGFGCEDYAYFDKYMITAASYIYPAYIFCNEEIPCGEADLSPITAETSEYFHKLFMRAGDYYAEFDTNADPHYDCSGIGRIHKKGAPSTICLSVPCPSEPNYAIGEDRFALSICPGILTDGGMSFATGEKYSVVSHFTRDGEAYAKLKTVHMGRELYLGCTLKKDCVLLEASGEGDIALLLPVIDFDGEEHSEIAFHKNLIEAHFGGSVLSYSSEASLADSGKKGGNRNGIYRAFYASGRDSIKVRLEIK